MRTRVDTHLAAASSNNSCRWFLILSKNMNEGIDFLSKLMLITSALNLAVSGAKRILSFRLRLFSSYPFRFTYGDGSIGEQMIAFRVRNWRFKQDRLVTLRYFEERTFQIGSLPISNLSLRNTNLQELYVPLDEFLRCGASEMPDKWDFKLVATFESGKTKICKSKLLLKKWGVIQK